VVIKRSSLGNNPGVDLIDIISQEVGNLMAKTSIARRREKSKRLLRHLAETRQGRAREHQTAQAASGTTDSSRRRLFRFLDQGAAGQRWRDIFPTVAGVRSFGKPERERPLT